MSPPQLPQVDGRGRRLLVVDDDRATRVLLQEVMKRLGFKVDQAVDGAEALDRAASADYDLILLDLRMPNVSGPEFLTRRRGEHQHIIVFTGVSDDEIKKIPEGSVCHRLRKPFDLTEFLERVASCLKSGSHAARNAAKTES